MVSEGRSSIGIPEFDSVEVGGNDAIPLEYRYGTGLLGTFLVGVGLLLLALLAVRGPLAVWLVFVSLPPVLLGMIAMAADPSGVIRSAGKRLVVDDRLVQEVDERGSIVWGIAPGQVARVQVVPGRPVFPLGAASWRAESWNVMLDDGRVIRIPVWLLPHRGRQFKQRFRVFLAQRRQVQQPGTGA